MKSCRVLVVLCAIISISTLLPAQSPPTDILPGDNLVTDGIPSIPAAIAATTNRYTEFRTAGLQDWHPTQRSILITTRFGETSTGAPHLPAVGRCGCSRWRANSLYTF